MKQCARWLAATSSKSSPLAKLCSLCRIHSPLITSNAIRHEIIGEGLSSQATECRDTARLRSSSTQYEGINRIRGIVSDVKLAKGATIALIPFSSAFSADRAVSLLTQREFMSTLYNPFVSRDVSAVASNVKHAIPFMSRDALLITLALAVLQRNREQRQPKASQPMLGTLEEWVALLPQRVPCMGALLQSSVDSTSMRVAPRSGPSRKLLARRLRVGKETTLLPPGDPFASHDKDIRALVLKQLTAQSFGNEAAVATSGASPPPALAVLTPSVEVIPTADMMVKFYRGDVPAASLRVGDDAPLKSHRIEEDRAFRHLSELQQIVDSTLVQLAAVITRAANQPSISRPSSVLEVDDDEVACSEEPEQPSDNGAWLEALRWAHFTLRSRSVSLGVADKRSVLLLPLLDMFNHNGTGKANVTFHVVEGREEPHVCVVTSRTVLRGEELTLDYRNYDLRQAVLETIDDCTGASGEMFTASNRRQMFRSDVEQAIKRIETEQRFEVVPLRQKQLDDAETALRHSVDKPRIRCTEAAKELQRSEAEILGGGDGGEVAEQRRKLCDRYNVLKRTSSALADAEWLFYFGFARSAKEKEHIASKSWDYALKDRVAKLTDIRRKGRVGEYVVGVPEGLGTLHQAREQLQRERYHRQKIFPPQRV